MRIGNKTKRPEEDSHEGSDPLGLISPAIIKGNMLLQMLWSRGYDRDDEIHDDIASEIQSWFDQLSVLSQVRIPRCIRLFLTVTRAVQTPVFPPPAPAKKLRLRQKNSGSGRKF